MEAVTILTSSGGIVAVVIPGAPVCNVPSKNAAKMIPIGELLARTSNCHTH